MTSLETHPKSHFPFPSDIKNSLVVILVRKHKTKNWYILWLRFYMCNSLDNEIDYISFLLSESGGLKSDWPKDLISLQARLCVWEFEIFEVGLVWN